MPIDEGDSAHASRDGRFVLWLMPLVALAVLEVWLSTGRYGVGITPDSVGYIAAGQSVLAGKGFQYFDGRPFVDQPPGFPLLLAGCQLLGFAPDQAARALNALSFGAIVGVAGLLLRRLGVSRWAATLGTCAVTVSVPLHEVACFAWTEPLFILCALLCCDRLTHYATTGVRLSFGAAVLFAALTCLLRYIGLTVVLASAGVLLLMNGGASVGKRGRDAALFAGLAILPLTVWCFRNWLISGTLFGARVPTTLAWTELLVLTADTVAGWILIHRVPQSLRLCTLGLALVALVGIGMKQIWASRLDAWTRFFLQLDVMFIFVYVAWLLLSAASVAFDLIGNRLLSPVFVPLVLLTVFACDRLRTMPAQSRMGRWGAIAGSAGVAVCLALPALTVARQTRAMAANGAGGYSTSRWQDSPLVANLRRHPLPGLVYSNHPDALFALTGQAIRMSPRKIYHNRSTRHDVTALPAFRQELSAAGTASLVWFPDSPRRYLYGVEELSKVAEVERVAAFPDGEIYALHRRDHVARAVR